MNIGVLDVDSTIPNLALMKLAAFHRGQGDHVEWYVPLLRETYDHVYASTIFDFSDKSILDPQTMEIGGTGWPDAEGKNLPREVEECIPDYTLYDYPHNIGFTMRGCRLRCPFCVVPEKEGRPRSQNTVDELWTQRDSDFLMLLDNDFFGNPEWRDRIDEMRRLDLRVNFNQGLNIRNIKPDQAEALASVRFTNTRATAQQVMFAWDDPRHEKLIHKGIRTCIDAGIQPRQMGFYVLIGYWSTPEQDRHRVELLRDYGCDPYVMPYKRDDPYQRAFARWVNHRAIFNSTTFENYRESVKRKPRSKDQLPLIAGYIAP